MKAQSFQRIGITANLGKEAVIALLPEIVESLLKCGFDLFFDPDISSNTKLSEGAAIGIPDDVDLIIALGGDGTILKWAREIAEKETPILGLRGGRLGFLAEGRTEKFASWLREGRYTIQERMRIHARILDGSKPVREFSALNDVVVHGTGFSRMVTVRVWVQGKLMKEYSADGMIVATPTGSTAYSLSAGGPVLEPTLQAIVLTPLNPHTMTVRPIVVHADHHVVVEVTGQRETGIMVTVDGQEGAPIGPEQVLDVVRSEKHTYLVVPDDYDFLRLLREKL